MARVEKGERNQALRLNDDFVTYAEAGEKEWGGYLKQLRVKALSGLGGMKQKVFLN